VSDFRDPVGPTARGRSAQYLRVKLLRILPNWYTSGFEAWDGLPTGDVRRKRRNRRAAVAATAIISTVTIVLLFMYYPDWAK
jgi:hypothetical protein